MMNRRRRRTFPRLGLLMLALLVSLCLTGIGYGAWTDQVTIEGTITTGTWDVGGSMGFWQTWWTHYNKVEVEDWLVTIDASSKWLGPTTVEGLDDLFLAKGGCGSKERMFLAHYMAIRLNIVSGRLDPGNTHDITGIPGHEYLGLTNPASATLWAVVLAIEAKYPQDPEDEAAVWPTGQQYEIMKDICDAINSLQT